MKFGPKTWINFAMETRNLFHGCESYQDKYEVSQGKIPLSLLVLVFDRGSAISLIRRFLNVSVLVETRKMEGQNDDLENILEVFRAGICLDIANTCK